ncbi:MAG: hypothetical protein EBY49_07845, partial [Actinobacteria bacterium]|nr:hypothetical protein [Actinomycetota bacterium]
DLDLIAGARDLNLRSSWDAFLRNLAEVKADLDASAKQNANAQTKETIRGRIEQNRRDLGGFGSASRDNFDFAGKALSAMRMQFGGHHEKKS